MNPIKTGRYSFALIFEDATANPTIHIDVDKEEGSLDLTCYMPSDATLDNITRYLSAATTVATKALSEINNDN